MDPNMTLHKLREKVAEALASRDRKTERFRDWTPDAPESALWQLAEAFDNLDGWLSKGGAVPDAWRETEDHR